MSEVPSPPPIRLGLVGIGKIARDQHVPAIAADPGFVLTATASHSGTVEGIPAYPDIAALIAGCRDLDAVSLCTPAAGRHAIAAAAIDAGLHVMLEKPPAATLSEIADLKARAADAGVTLFATWHSREATGVAPARAWLAQRTIHAVSIVWKEDVRRWHPGQEWILAAGGFGVFDPGINALSIASAILPDPLLVETARIVVPEGRAAPIAATVTMRSGAAPVSVDLSFLQTGPQHWDIIVETDAGTLRLADGGSVLTLPGQPPITGEDREYRQLYGRFRELIVGADSDVDVVPLQLVADAFLVAEHEPGAAFAF